MKTALKRILDILRTGEIEYSEIQGTLAGLVWGIGIVLLPVQSKFGLNSVAIGVSLAFVALMQLLGISHMRYSVRRAGALMSGPVWAVVAVLALDIGNPWSFFISSTCVGCAISAVWGYIRIGDRERKRRR